MKTNIVIIALGAVFSGDAIGQTNQIAMTTDPVVTKNAAPAPAANEIVTRIGATYEGVEILKVEPNGLTMGYTPKGGGIGIIKIPFDELSDDLQKKYGYNFQKASEYQVEQQKAVGWWREKLIADEAAARAKREAEEKEAAGKEAAGKEAAEKEAAEKEAAEKAANAATIQATNSPSTNAIPQPQSGGY
jgi:hypothetical protein